VSDQIPTSPPSLRMTIAEADARLDELLSWVDETGGRVELTRAGRVVALILPPPEGDSATTRETPN
jgi:antitoxin (DNA-binding transcriptional repressor) of toxin-antitoxin stability system